MRLFAVGWSATKIDPVAGKIRISTGVSKAFAVDADRAEGAVLRSLRKSWSPKDGWTLATAITEITPDDLGRLGTEGYRIWQ